MLTLGLDPGLGTTGYGLVRQNGNGDLELIDYGVILTPARQALENRLLVLYEQMRNLLLLHKPDHAAVEKLFFAKNITTAISVGHARGVMMLALAQSSIKVVEFSPPEIKQAITGYGGADKHQMQVMVQSILELDDLPRPDDAADALAVAICQLHRARYDQLQKGPTV
ncbi:MAG: crossover junction endodeoxyribonuclease RuvC [Anaerolineae bacterium]|jgi:crossover junction endodeoxyribonuclease RuvC|nr:crossover junction endodeoxyribonuclease RuvC [Anaerolineae bacterium]